MLGPSMLLLEKASSLNTTLAVLGSHLVLLLAMPSYVFVGGILARIYEGYSYSLMEKPNSRIRQIRRELDSVTEEHLNRQFLIHNDLRKWDQNPTERCYSPQPSEWRRLQVWSALFTTA